MRIAPDRTGPALRRLLAVGPALVEQGLLPAAEADYLAVARAALAETAALVADPDPRIAAQAARALGRLAAAGVVIAHRAELRDALAAPDALVRRAAIEALGALRDGASAAALVAIGAGPDVETVVAARAAVARVFRRDAPAALAPARDGGA
jgi:HEAT repeat protein